MVRVTLRLPDELHKALAAHARASNTSLNQAIVNILSDALGCGKSTPLDETPQERERRLLREALGDLVVDFEPEAFSPLFHPLPDNFDRTKFLKSLPRMDPPLSRAIIEDREDRF